MVEVKFYDNVADEFLKFAVIISKTDNKWVFCKHKERETYEIPGGHREPGESILETAKRELQEETGAVDFRIEPICVYSVKGKTRVNENIAGKNRERRVEQMTAVTEDEKALSPQIAELNSDRSFVIWYGGVWKLLSAVDKLQQYGAAAEATVGQVLTYNGKLKLVPYHEISSGKTRDGKEVFHSADYGYLKSVESSQDREAPDYVNSTYVPASQLPAKLVVKKRDSAGYVTALTADGNWLEGETFRQGMHLASADFSVQKVGKMVRFLCKGKGHGLGFSQYGGNEMAKKGSSWEEILETYFPEMEVEVVMEMGR